MKALILMKLAVLAFLSLDARAGAIPQPELRPYDEVLTDFKERVAKNELPADVADAGLNQMEIWSQRGGKVKHHRFDLATVNRGAPIEVKQLVVDHEAALKEIERLQKIIDDAGQPSLTDQTIQTGQTDPASATPPLSDEPTVENEIQPASVSGLDSSGPGVETPPASEASIGNPKNKGALFDGDPDTTEVASASPPPGGKKRSR